MIVVVWELKRKRIKRIIEGEEVRTFKRQLKAHAETCDCPTRPAGLPAFVQTCEFYDHGMEQIRAAAQLDEDDSFTMGICLQRLEPSWWKEVVEIFKKEDAK